MAAVADDEKKFDNSVFEQVDDISKEELSKLHESCQEAYNYKCKFDKQEDCLIFWPSPHLLDKNGQIKKEKDRKKFEYTNLNHACSFVASSMNCDKVEAAFQDHGSDELKNSKVIRQSFQLKHGFIMAAERAWSQHYPFRIDPIHIWLLILQGVALHVDMNAEKLRSKWVNFEGQKKLVVNRDEFVKGLREKNDWGQVIVEFCQQIDKNTTKDSVSLLEANFSNANDVDKVAAKVTIMDICKSYFEYVVRTRCGFPQIRITGKREDWVKIYQKTETLLATKVDQEFGKQWSKALLPILKRFVQAFDGKIDCLFWNSMIKRGERRGSGGWSWYSGWFNIFFPYIKNKPNEFCVPYQGTSDYITGKQEGIKEAGAGNDTSIYPYGLASAPVKWQYLSLEFKLKFISGFVGVTHDAKTDELYPKVGWVIGEQTKENSQAMKDLQTQFQKNKQISPNNQ